MGIYAKQWGVMAIVTGDKGESLEPLKSLPPMTRKEAENVVAQATPKEGERFTVYNLLSE